MYISIHILYFSDDEFFLIKKFLINLLIRKHISSNSYKYVNFQTDS